MRSKPMISIYKFVEGESILVGKYNTQCEHEALNKYLGEINSSMESFRFLGELGGMVYRMSFEMKVNGKTDEYFFSTELTQTMKE